MKSEDKRLLLAGILMHGFLLRAHESDVDTKDKLQLAIIASLNMAHSMMAFNDSFKHGEAEVDTGKREGDVT